MVDSNITRPEILPSEKAFAYKMKMEAIRHQGARTDLTSGPVGEKMWSIAVISNEASDSERQVHRFIRLTELIPELLERVDQKHLKMRPAVELSYLKPDEQRNVFEVAFNGLKYGSVTYDQAKELRSQSQAGIEISSARVSMVMYKPNANEIQKNIKLTYKIRSMLPKSCTKTTDQEEYLARAIEFYKQNNKDADD